MRSTPGVWVRLVVVAPLLALLAALPAAPVGAAAAITFELVPGQPTAGRPALLVVRTWLPGTDGPDQSEPLDMSGYPFDVRAYRAAEFPGTHAPADRGFFVELAQVETNTWHAPIAFPSPGRWVVVFRNWFPPVAGTPPPGFPATLTVTVLTAAGAPASDPLPPPPGCPVTLPNGDMPPSGGNPEFVGGYGNEALWTNLWMWGEGPVPVEADPERPGGTRGPGKWAWWRYAPGDLTIEGRRLDGLAPPLRAEVPEGYGSSGFQVSSLDFPTAGCWEVAGRVGDASLIFVVLVVQTDAGRPAG